MSRAVIHSLSAAASVVIALAVVVAAVVGALLLAPPSEHRAAVPASVRPGPQSADSTYPPEYAQPAPETRKVRIR